MPENVKVNKTTVVNAAADENARKADIANAAAQRVYVTQPMIGLLYCQVCAVNDASDEEILREANNQNPCGTRNGWCHVVRSESDLDGKAAERSALPGPCADIPGRTHFILMC